MRPHEQMVRIETPPWVKSQQLGPIFLLPPSPPTARLQPTKMPNSWSKPARAELPLCFTFSYTMRIPSCPSSTQGPNVASCPEASSLISEIHLPLLSAPHPVSSFSLVSSPSEEAWRRGPASWASCSLHCFLVHSWITQDKTKEESNRTLGF